ncbi:hypothetical protein ACLOJK_009958 [Asimina triloba]
MGHSSSCADVGDLLQGLPPARTISFESAHSRSNSSICGPESWLWKAATAAFSCAVFVASLLILNHAFLKPETNSSKKKSPPKNPSWTSVVSLTVARGTIGYMPPELFYRNVGGVSHKSDVYSFGMLLLDMGGRRKKMQAFAQDSSELYFPSWIYDQISCGGEVEMGTTTDDEKQMAKKLIIAGLWCIQMKPVDRPSMSRFVEMLEGSVDLLRLPPKAFLSSPEHVSSEEYESMDGTEELDEPMLSHISLQQ